MKGIRILAAAGALLMTESLWSCGLLPAEEEELAPPLAAPAAVSYTTTRVERGDIVDSINVSGTFVSTRSYELSFEKRAGYLSEITVKAGDTVEEGQMLARLDTDGLKKDEKQQELFVERAKIALDAAKASENATQSSIRLAEIDYELQNYSWTRSGRSFQSRPFMPRRTGWSPICQSRASGITFPLGAR